MFKWKRLAFVVVILLVVIIIQSRNNDIRGPFKGIIGNIINPFVYIADKAFSDIGDLWRSYVDLRGLREENLQYKSIVDNLTLQNNLLREKMSQTERLQELLRFSDAYDFSRMSANVIGASTGFVKTIIIDRGSDDGVKVNDPIIGFKGLVGRVSSIYKNSAEVDVLLNPASNVSAMSSRTRAVGILRGDGKGRLYIDYYDRLDDVKPGDVFITSGLGRLFPKGIPIGVASDIIKGQTGLFQKVYIEQNEDFYKLENVFVVKDFKK